MYSSAEVPNSALVVDCGVATSVIGVLIGYLQGSVPFFSQAHWLVCPPRSAAPKGAFSAIPRAA